MKIRGSEIGDRESKTKNRTGFTLIELILALTIFSVLGTAVYSSFSMGIEMWKRGEYQQRAYQDIRIFLETFSKDLHNATELADVPFLGESGDLEFAVTLRQEDESGNIVLTFGVVRYHVEEDKDSIKLYRKESPFPGEADDEERDFKIVGDVKKISLQYYGYEVEEEEEEGKEAPTYAWYEKWDSYGYLPKAVWIRMTVQDKSRYGRIIDISRKIMIYSGTGKIIGEEV